MNDLRTIEGWFRFPPGSETAFGTLEIRPRDLRLKLRESPRPWEERDEQATVIHGDSLDGKPLTLLGAFATRRSNDVEEFRFNGLLIGIHVMDERELVFARGLIHLRGLREWLSEGHSGGSSLRRKDREELPDPLELTIEHATVSLAYTKHTSLSPFQDTVSVDAQALIDLNEPLPVGEWREKWVRPLQNFLVFATREQVVVESFHAIVSIHGLAEGIAPEIRPALPDNVWERHEIEIVRPQDVEVRERGIEPFRHMLLPRGALGDRAPAALAKFFEVHRALGRTAAFFFVVLNTRTIYEENRLLNLMAFSEGYHRTFHDQPPLSDDVHEELKDTMLEAIDAEHRPVYESPLKYANQQTQRQRLKVLIARAAAAQPSLADPRNAFCTALVDTRNQYTHQGEPGSNVIPDSELYEHVERLIEVLEVNLLLDLGVAPGDIPALHANAHGS
jgi:hypothetical protein